MPNFARIPQISRLAVLSFALSCGVSHAATDDAAKKKAAAKAIAAAVVACDAGATAPLDSTAKSAPVQFFEMYPADFDMTKLKALQSKCQEAWVGAPKEKRMHLQWLRVTIMLGESGTEFLTPQVRQLADAGSAEAQFLLYQMFRLKPSAEESSAMAISADDARTSLIRAAEQGHLTALQELMIQYRGGMLFPRDLKKVVQMGRRIESAPPQGIKSTEYEDRIRAAMPLTVAMTTLEDDSFPPTEQRMAFRFLETDVKTNASNGYSTVAYANALRLGRGTSKDLGRARELLEARATQDKYAIPPLADMLAKGEGGPVDVKRALAMLRSDDLKYVPGAASVRADILLSGKGIGRQPQEAIQVLAGSYDVKDLIRLAGLLIDYHPRLDTVETIISRLNEAAETGNAEAAMALVRLKLSDNSQFSDEPGARVLLKPLADNGDRAALWLYAATQYSNLGSTSYRPMRQQEGLSDGALQDLIAEGISRREPEASLLKAKLLRRGVLYPQDDQAATRALIEAADLGNVEAMVLLGEAYGEGQGVAKDSRKRLDAWRKAAKLGSLEAKSRISRAFTFDTFDRLMTLEEGITWRIALYNNGVGRRLDGLGIGSDTMAEVEFMGLFMGRAMEAGSDAVAEAVMNAFREAPAGLADQNLVGLGKAFPDEIRVAIERKLKKEGFYRGQPQGFWGPDVRKALADWVDAEGPINEEAVSEPTVLVDQSTGENTDLVSPEVLSRVRTFATKQLNAAKSNRQRIAALKNVNALAQYGDMQARWALVPNYHQVSAVRQAVSVAEITRYGLDVMITRPSGAEKAEFEFIFNTTQIYQDGKSGDFGEAVITAIRDDVRLRDPLMLGSILKQFIFAPGACDAVLDAGRRAKVRGVGQDGCDEATLTALIAFAKARGPTGIDAATRKAAAVEIETMDAEASR